MDHGINHIHHQGSPTTSGSPESINGLKFGQKIYFEEVGIASNGPTCKTISNSNKNNGMTAKKGPIPRCQVEGCNVDLSDAKTYYLRHKVCGFHSKSPMVIVSGLEQRFCQQCSRFHQLPEFDQGKRSCRRRLAGHNERRRKPAPGSLLSSRLGRLSSSFFGGRYDNWAFFTTILVTTMRCFSAQERFTCVISDRASKSGGFLLDFSSYPSNPGKELWPDTKPSERVPGNQLTSAGRYRHNIWSGNSEEPPQSKMFLPGSAGESSFSFPSGECITGVSSDSTCALSLLSNQTWSSTNSSSSNKLGNLMNTHGASISAHDVTVARVGLPVSNNSSLWDLKNSEANAGYQVMQPDHLGPRHVSRPVGDQFHGNLLIEHVHSGGLQYMEVDHSRNYNSDNTGNVNWSLF